MRRRTVLAGAAWAVPSIMIATPSGGATLSAPATVAAPPATETPQKSHTLAFTGDNTEQDAFVGAAAILAGWAIVHWNARTAPHDQS